MDQYANGAHYIHNYYLHTMTMTVLWRSYTINFLAVGLFLHVSRCRAFCDLRRKTMLVSKSIVHFIVKKLSNYTTVVEPTPIDGRLLSFLAGVTRCRQSVFHCSTQSSSNSKTTSTCTTLRTHDNQRACIGLMVALRVSNVERSTYFKHLTLRS